MQQTPQENIELLIGQKAHYWLSAGHTYGLYADLLELYPELTAYPEECLSNILGLIMARAQAALIRFKLKNGRERLSTDPTDTGVVFNWIKREISIAYTDLFAVVGHGIIPVFHWMLLEDTGLTRACLWSNGQFKIGILERELDILATTWMGVDLDITPEFIANCWTQALTITENYDFEHEDHEQTAKNVDKRSTSRRHK